MCIVVYKSALAKFPDKEILENCFTNNDDGAGFMFAVNGKVHIRKGFMTFDKFYKELKKAVSIYGESLPYVFHFRISTQGGVRKDCCHPFPLSKNMKALRELAVRTNIGIAHNGIIPLTSDYSKKSVDYNDTMKFITEFLTLIIRNNEYYKDKDTLTLIERLSESKLAILDGNGHCELIGKGWINDGGIYYSNDTYQEKYLNYYYRPYYYNYEYEKAYDEESGLYQFSLDDCPLSNDGDCDYCECCHNYPNCFVTG